MSIFIEKRFESCGLGSSPFFPESHCSLCTSHHPWLLAPRRGSPRKQLWFSCWISTHFVLDTLRMVSFNSTKLWPNWGPDNCHITDKEKSITTLICLILISRPQSLGGSAHFCLAGIFFFFFCYKGSDGKYRLCGPCGLCCNHSTLHCLVKAALNEQVWLCTNKTLFVETDI